LNKIVENQKTLKMEVKIKP